MKAKVSAEDPSDSTTPSLHQQLVPPTNAPLNENYPFHNGLIRFASSTQLEGRNDNPPSEPLWLFFSHPSLSGTFEGPTLLQLSGNAQLRCNNPNPHSLQFSHLGLHTHLP